MATSATPPVTLGNFTGVDFNQLLQAVIAEAQIPVTNLNSQVTADNAEISALGQVGGLFSGLQNSLTQLNTDATTVPLTASAPATAPFSASVTGTPLVGTYNVTVNRLAAAQSSASQGYASDTNTVGTGTLSIKIGNTTSTINITSANDTLDGVATAINQANLGLNAQVVNTGLPADPYRLEITSTTTGASGAFSVSSSLSGGTAPNFTSNSIGSVELNSVSGTAPISVSGTYTGTLSQGYQFTVVSGGTVGSSTITIDYTSDSGESGTITVPQTYPPSSPVAVADGVLLSLGSGTLNTGDKFSVAAFNPTISSAQNASVQIGNQIISSATNNVSNAIPGVTLALNATGGPATVTVSQDQTALSSDVSSFVTAYNNLQAKIQAETQALPKVIPPPLANDGALETASYGLQVALGAINLSNLGLTVDSKTGLLQFSSSNFASQFQTSPSQVIATMTAIYQGLNGPVTNALNPSTGVIANETNTTQDQITSLNQQIGTLNNQITQEQNQLQSEYAAIQANVSSYQNLSLLLSEQYGSSSSSSSSIPSIPTPGSNLSISG